jgi:hypothetical protein
MDIHKCPFSILSKTLPEISQFFLTTYNYNCIYYRMPTKRYRNRSLKKNQRSSTKTNTILSLGHETIPYFLETLNAIKLHHWRTHSYATHKATDELYSNVNSSIDSFVEVLLGKCQGNRVDLTTTKSVPFHDIPSTSIFEGFMISFRDYLVSLNNHEEFMSPTNVDLVTIRDELLGHVNKFLYLLTLT